MIPCILAVFAAVVFGDLWRSHRIAMRACPLALPSAEILREAKATP